MGGRGSLGGTRSTYRGNSTTLYRQKQAQGGDAGSGGGGGSTKNKTGNAGAGTGGIEGGGGSVEGGGGSAVETKPTETDQTTDTDSSTATDTNEQTLPLTDEQLVDMFEGSAVFDALITLYPGDVEYKRNRPIFYSRWLKSEGINEEPPAPQIDINFGPGLTNIQKIQARANLDTLPVKHREGLEARGLRVQVSKRADEADTWPETGYTSTQKTRDNREMGDLSFYEPTSNQVFISVDGEDGSVNLYVHELAHAVDFTWFKTPGSTSIGKSVEWPVGSGTMVAIYRVSDDPEWIDVHLDLLSNPQIRKYYKYGPNDPPAVGQAATPASLRAGRSELFAEGFAHYNDGGIASLTGFVHSLDKALKLEAIWRRHGVID